MGALCSCSFCNIINCCSWCGWEGENHENWKQLDEEGNPDWMGKLIKINPDVLLRDCMIVGTHDSACGHLNQFKCCSSLAVTTNISIYEQLVKGARYLDIRLSGNGKNPHNVITCHGIMDICVFATTGAKNDLHLTDVSQIINQSGENRKCSNLKITFLKK
jgi:hypothetical protein